MLDTVKINHVQHISFTQSRLTDAVSVILSELLSYEHPSNGGGVMRQGAFSGRGREALKILIIKPRRIGKGKKSRGALAADSRPLPGPPARPGRRKPAQRAAAFLGSSSEKE